MIARISAMTAAITIAIATATATVTMIARISAMTAAHLVVSVDVTVFHCLLQSSPRVDVHESPPPTAVWQVGEGKKLTPSRSESQNCP